MNIKNEKTMYIEDIMNRLSHDKDLNFLAMAITPYQAVGVNASIQYLLENGIIPKGFILLTAHPESGRSIDLNIFNVENTKIELLEFDYSFGKKKTSLESISVKLEQIRGCNKTIGNDNFYFVWTEIANNLVYAINKSVSNKNLSFIKIDDGAASYISPFKCRLSYMMYDLKTDGLLSRMRAYIKAFLYATQTNICENSLKKRRHYINANIFVKGKRKNELIKNESFSKYYVDVLANSANKTEFEMFSNSIIINSQGLGEFHVTDGKVDFEAFKKLASILSALKVNVVLKPHPREKQISKYEELGWHVFENRQITQEEILANVDQNPKCIISIYSSTLLNAYGMFNVPVISLAKILLNEKITRNFQIELKRYYKMYQSIVIFPNTYDELKTIIKEL